MDDERTARLIWIGAGGVVPVLVAGGLVGLRDVTLNANIALVLVAIVVIVAAAGGRHAGAAAAISASVSFDFFHTRPYQHLSIASRDDVETTLLLLAVGLLVGHVASAGRRARSTADATRGEIKRIHRVAESAARGDDTADVVLAAQAELLDLLRLRDCRFELAPFSPPMEQLERGGTMSTADYRYRDGGFELPEAGIELPVLGRGHLFGRFVLMPSPDVGVTLEARIVAVALADQVGAALAASQPHPS